MPDGLPTTDERTIPLPQMSAGAARRLVAGAVVVALGLTIVVAAVPFLMGLLGGPLLAVLFGPAHRQLARLLSPRWSAGVVVALAVVAVLVPAGLVVTLVVNEAPAALNGPGAQQLIADIAALRIQGFVVGPELAKASSAILTWLSREVVVGAAFAVVGLDHPLLWGVVTGVVSVLPVFGSALVWLPGVVVLLVEHRTASAIGLAAIGVIVASNIDNVIRPVVYRRASGLHPMLTIVGAFIGLKYFGLFGVLIGPLALAFFFELVRAFEHEHLHAPDVTGNAG